MQKFCDKPDRDSPKLTCGYPFPCPHHMVVIDGDSDPIAQVALLEWAKRYPVISIGIQPAPPSGTSIAEIEVCAYVRFSLETTGDIWKGKRVLPVNCKPQEIRDACDELTREGILALEGGSTTLLDQMLKELEAKPNAVEPVEISQELINALMEAD